MISVFKMLSDRTFGLLLNIVYFLFFIFFKEREKRNPSNKLAVPSEANLMETGFV